MKEFKTKIENFVKENKAEILDGVFIGGVFIVAFVSGRVSARTMQEYKATAIKDGVVIEEFHRIIVK